MYNYKCVIVRVIDGDTVDIDIDLGFSVWLRNQRVRLQGIDTPESRTKDLAEKAHGLAAKSRLIELLPVGSKFQIATAIGSNNSDMHEKFGRILGNFMLPGTNNSVSDVLMSEGYAVPYTGQSKDDVKQLHLKNRQRLISEGKLVIKGN
jgi:micrococcal nuclease